MINADTYAGRRALIVVDAQQGFDDDASYWGGPRNNPAFEENVHTLLDGFAAEGAPIVLVRHDSRDPASPLHPDRPGNAFKPVLNGVEPALLVPKQVHSAFHGQVDLHAWLQDEGIAEILICGIQTNRCCETTARLGGDLGYDVKFVLDATATFDEPAQQGRPAISADALARATATNLHGHFAEVTTTAEVLGKARAAA